MARTAESQNRDVFWSRVLRKVAQDGKPGVAANWAVVVFRFSPDRVSYLNQLANRMSGEEGVQAYSSLTEPEKRYVDYLVIASKT